MVLQRSPILHELRTIQANYLRLETLNNANDRINNATAKLPIFKHYYIQEGRACQCRWSEFEAKQNIPHTVFL